MAPTVRDATHRLLLACAGATADPAHAVTVATLAAGQVDWDELVLAAHQHRVLPLVHRALRRVPGTSVPAPIMAVMHQACQANARRNLWLTRELLASVAALETEGIPVLPYKGPALAAFVYGDLSLRQFSDLDILVPKPDVERALSILFDRGYRAQRELGPGGLPSALREEKDLTLVRENPALDLEIHWDITTSRDPIRLPIDGLWRRASTAVLTGRSVRVLAPEDQLFVLCIHGAKHRWERIGWVCDVATLIRREEGLDWDLALRRAGAAGGARILLLGAWLAGDLFGVTLPPSLAHRIERDDVVRSLGGEVRAWLFDDSRAELDLGERERFFMRLRERPRDRVAVAFQQARAYLAPTARDQEAVPLPPGFQWLLYPVRPLRLAARYGLRPVVHFIKGLFES